MRVPLVTEGFARQRKPPASPGEIYCPKTGVFCRFILTALNYKMQYGIDRISQTKGRGDTDEEVMDRPTIISQRLIFFIEMSGL